MREQLAEIDDVILCADGFDGAIIGYVEQFGRPPIALYDKEKCLEIMMIRDKMTYDEAIEYFEYNVIGSYVGEYTPAFATLFEK